MDVLAPSDLPEALEMKMHHPEAVLIAGGTDVMVDVNFGRLRPRSFIDICAIAELRDFGDDGGLFFLGSGVTYARMVRDLQRFAPLATAARTIGSPQIRNRATVGGNLGTASPAGDSLPVLAAFDASVVLRSAERGLRVVPWHDFLIGPRVSSLQTDEVIVGCRWKPVQGPGAFSKVGARNAMVIAVASLCLVLDETKREVRIALGSVGPRILRAPDAERVVAEGLSDSGGWDDPTKRPDERLLEHFGALVADAVSPIDDVRGSARYRRRACEVMAKRALTWSLQERVPAGSTGSG